MINIILCSIAAIFIIAFILILRSLYLLKKGLDEIVVKIMKDHETFISVQRNILKELKDKVSDLMRLEKDINTIRSGLKSTLEEFKNKIKSIAEKTK